MLGADEVTVLDRVSGSVTSISSMADFFKWAASVDSVIGKVVSERALDADSYPVAYAPLIRRVLSK